MQASSCTNLTISALIWVLILGVGAIDEAKISVATEIRDETSGFLGSEALLMEEALLLMQIAESRRLVGEIDDDHTHPLLPILLNQADQDVQEAKVARDVMNNAFNGLRASHAAVVELMVGLLSA